MYKIDEIKMLRLGQRDENLARALTFDCSDWLEQYPEASIHILFRRPGESAIVPMSTTLEGATLTWLIHDFEVGKTGIGNAEFRAVDTAGLRRKSRIIPCSIEETLLGDDETVLYTQDQVDETLAHISEAAQAAQAAKASEEAAALSAQNAAESATSASAAASVATSARDAARAAKDAAETAQHQAEAAQSGVHADAEAAEQAKVAAQAAQAGAQGAASQASADRVAAETARSDAEAAAVHAEAVVEGIDQAGADQVAAVNAAGQAQVTAVNAAGTTQVGNVNAAGTTQVNAVQAKGTQVINSIPADYSALSSDVTDLKSALDVTNENVDTVVHGGNYEQPVTGYTSGMRVSGYKSDGTLNIIENARWSAKIIDVGDNKTLLSNGKLVASSLGVYSAIVLLADDETVVTRTSAAVISGSNISSEQTTQDWLTYTSTGYVVDLVAIKSLYPNFSKLCLCYIPASNPDFSWELSVDISGLIELQDDIENFDFTGKINRSALSNDGVTNVEISEYSNVCTIEQNRRISGKSGGKPAYSNNPSCRIMGFEIAELANSKLYSNSIYLETFGSGIPAHSFITIVDSDENVLIQHSYAVASVNDAGIVYAYHEIPLSINVGELITSYPQAARIYITDCYKEYPLYVTSVPMPEWMPQTAGLAKTLYGLDAFVQKPFLDLPPFSVAVVGHEWNMYHQNILGASNRDHYALRYSFSPSLSGIRHMNDQLRITPTSSNVGTYVCTVECVNPITEAVYASGSFVLYVIADTAVVNKNVMFIGDSLTARGLYSAEITKNLSNGGIVSVGTLTKEIEFLDGTTFTTLNEGRAGWSAQDYTGKAEYAGYTNAFWDGTGFNFSYYMSNNTNVPKPDIICINLGTNGGTGVDGTVTAISQMIASIHAYDASIPVLVSLIPPPADQDGVSSRNNLSNAKIWRIGLGLGSHAKYKAAFGQMENVFLTDPYINLDTLRDYDMIEAPASSRNPMLIKYENNNVHPSYYGYLKFADTYYNHVLYHLTKT